MPASADATLHLGTPTLSAAGRPSLVSQPIAAMDVEAQASIIQHIVSPSSECAAELLESLAIAEPPSRERIHAEIGERLLLPKQKLPDHWLSKYQM